jgi:hypothetical protein
MGSVSFTKIEERFLLQMHGKSNAKEETRYDEEHIVVI